MKYKEAGVDIEAGNAFVERLKEKLPNIGGFGGMYKLPSGYDKPILVSGADGVGTKINICSIARDYKTIGIDLVAMCVNDIITCGAKPLYFLDYISLSRINPVVDDIMEGIIKGCEIAGVELIGGETAEHPRAMDIDLAGFCTGIVEQEEIVDGRLIKKDDLIIGIESSGIHSNGYSLINKMLRENKLNYNLVPELLKPTIIYSSLVNELLYDMPILGMAHITGGGIPENLPRCIPDGLNAHVDYNSWNMPEIFRKIMLAGSIPPEEMKSIFNLGIGFCLVIPSEIETDVHKTVTKHGYNSWTIGQVTT